VRYHGAVAFDELHTHYQHADAFVFASSCENMPNILLEAMAAGLPIACSDRGPMPEVLGECGEYFDPECPQSLERALSVLLRDAAHATALSVKAATKVESYTWEECARRTFGFLRTVCESRGARGS
jgi:glycosyltransferase involved in cell wall biosynthesis